MHLTSLHLAQFKNYEAARLAFGSGLNGFVGPNGAGKTNLLEAIYYLCMGKGYGTAAEQYDIRHGDDGSRLEGNFVLNDGRVDKIVVKLRKRARKVIERNGTAYERIAEHVGRYPVVIIVPDDIHLVYEGSEARRRLLDNSLSQTDPTYLNYLISYNRLLANRNALLKKLEGYPDTSGLLEIYGQQMAPAVEYIAAARTAFVGPFAELLTAAHTRISGGEREQVSLSYRTQLAETSWVDLLTERAEKDRLLQRTTGGLHRDDLVFTQDGHPLRRVASQGQLKSFVLALKLAQYRLLERNTGRTPLLLLDDIFDKLDQQRVGQLLDLVVSERYGQVFLTDTNEDRVAALVDPATDWRRFRIQEGRILADDENE